MANFFERPNLEQNTSVWERVKTFFRNLRDGDNPFARAVRKLGLSYSRDTTGRGEFVESDFDLNDVNRAYNTDSYVRQALDKYIELMFKAGWNITYQRDEVKDYVKKRFSMLSDGMRKPIAQFWKDVAEDLVKFHNVFLVKARVSEDQLDYMPGVKVRGLGNKNPIGAYFRLPPETVQIKVDKNGNVKKYKQVVAGKEKEFNKDDVIHIAYKKPAGKFFGVPFIAPVLDDIRLLREVEDNVARLIYRHLNPLYLYTVGIAESGYEATDEEIEEMQKLIDDMPTEGGLVVPERHSVDVLGAEKEAIDATDYLKYYERRVFTGLGTSETTMGRGDTTNRSTAETQSAEMKDKVKAFQRTLSDAINYFVIRELLMEGGYDLILNEEDKAEFEFVEIDVDMEIKKENHVIYKFEHDATTHSEMRQELGMEPLEDKSELRSFMFLDSDTADVDNREEPENQHTSEFVQNKLGGAALENYVTQRYFGLRGEVMDYIEFHAAGIYDRETTREQVERSMQHAQRMIGLRISNAMREAFRKGAKRAGRQLDKEGDVVFDERLEEMLESYLEDFFTELEQKVLERTLGCEDANTALSFISALFKTVSYRLNYATRNLLMLAYNAGYAACGARHGVRNLYYQQDGGHYFEISLQGGHLERLPTKPAHKNYYLTFKKPRDRIKERRAS